MVLLRKKLLKYGTPKPSIFQPKTPKKASAMFQTHLWAARRQSLPKTNRAGGVLCLGILLWLLVGVLFIILVQCYGQKDLRILSCPQCELKSDPGQMGYISVGVLKPWP